MKDIFESGGNFHWTKGFFNDKPDNPGAYYFTDLPPESSNTEIKTAIYGSYPSRTDPQIHLQTYMYVWVDKRQVHEGRNHVFYIHKDSPNLDFEVWEFGQRKGWQTYKRPERDKWDPNDYIQHFRRKGRVSRNVKLVLKGMIR